MGLRFAYYADDFTGATDALDFLARSGVKVTLFIEPPSPDRLKEFPDLETIGVAGMTRSMNPEKMESALLNDFSLLKELEVKHVHYKVCSTFDSSPLMGSIGKAIEVGLRVFGNPYVPVLPAAPDLGRFCVFGNLFARLGIGSQGKIYRLDRHPSISQHPVTPMQEADLLIHLGQQTGLRIVLFDLFHLEQEINEVKKHWDTLTKDTDTIVLLDCFNTRHLASLGKLLTYLSGKSAECFFSVGSSGVEAALLEDWVEAGLCSGDLDLPLLGEVNPILVLSGSASLVSENQIQYALKEGFAQIAVNTALLVTEEGQRMEADRVVEEVLAQMSSGISTLVHTVCGRSDPRIEQMQESFEMQGYSPEEQQLIVGPLLGGFLGRIALRVSEKLELKRVIVAGGDTSSYAARAMGIESLVMETRFVKGAPMCKACAPGSSLDGLEMNFKGGQVGSESYFVTARDGMKV